MSKSRCLSKTIATNVQNGRFFQTAKKQTTGSEKKHTLLEQENIQLKKENERLKNANIKQLQCNIQLLLALSEFKPGILHNPDFHDLINKSITLWGTDFFLKPLPDELQVARQKNKP